MVIQPPTQRKQVTFEPNTAEPRDKSPAFRRLSKIEEKSDGVEGVLKKLLSTPVTITIGDMLAMDRTLRDAVKRDLTRRKVPLQNKVAQLLQSWTDEEYEYWTQLAHIQDIPDIIKLEEIPPARSYKELASNEENIRSGTIVVNDSVAQYLEAIPVHERPAIVGIAYDSVPLRTVFPKINNVRQEECVIDSGSQIVSMGREAAERCHLSWDPDLCIHLQSANRGMSMTLGLARNVPFNFEGITVYLQVHVIDHVAYNILLGRPFDAVAASGFDNDPEGKMALTIRCPNTGSRRTFSTYERGDAPAHLRGEINKRYQRPPEQEKHPKPPPVTNEEPVRRPPSQIPADPPTGGF